MKSYENGLPVDGNNDFITETNWGRVSRQNSLTYAFDNTNNARRLQDVGLDGLSNDDEYTFGSYKDYLDKLRNKLPASTIAAMQENPFSAMNDPAGDNYHFYRSNYYDETKAGVLERYKRYNGVEGNSLAPEDSSNPQYQSARAVPDVEDINQDNTLNEYEKYFQYRVSLRPEDLEVGKNYITDKQVSQVTTAEGPQTVVWYQFKVPLTSPEKVVGGINDFSTVRFARMFMTGFKEVTHLRFATLELVRGEWRDYKFNLNSRNDSPAEGKLDMSVVNIEENSGREPVNYVLPPGVTGSRTRARRRPLSSMSSRSNSHLPVSSPAMPEESTRTRRSTCVSTSVSRCGCTLKPPLTTSPTPATATFHSSSASAAT